MSLKKILMSLAVVGATLPSLAATIDLPAQETAARLLDNSRDGLRMSWSYDQLQSMDVTTQQGTFTELNIPGVGNSTETGLPKVPVSRRIISVPLGAKVSANALSFHSTDYKLSDLGISSPLMPAQPSLAKNQTPADVPFEYDADAYSRVRSFGEAPEISVEELGILRGMRLFTVNVEPVQYNPANGTMRVFSDVELQVNYTGADWDATNELRARTFSPYFESTYEQSVFNYSLDLPTRDVLTTYPVKYLIIYDPMFETQLEPFIEWKTQKGFNVVAASTSVTGTTTTSIKSYISNLWDAGTASDPAPSFLLFVGDIDQIPAFDGDSDSGHVTDNHYVRLEGSDYMPEIYYSRFSAQTTAQLQPQIDKTLEYERYEMADPSFLNEVVMIAGYDTNYGATYGNGQINYGTNYYFNTAHGITSHTHFYPQSGSDDALIVSEISAGCGFANYTAHGSTTSWGDPTFTITNINSLGNAGQYPTVVGNCCLTNSFQVSTCFGEAWLRAANKGAIGYIGATNSTYWDEDYWWGTGAGTCVSDPDIDDFGQGVYDGMFHERGEAWADWTTTQGAMLVTGNLAVVEGGSSRTTYYWEIYSLMGDCALSTYITVPEANTVSLPSNLLSGATSCTLAADPYSYVGLTYEGDLVAAGLVPASGNLTLNWTQTLLPGEATLVVTRQNRIPVISTVTVVPNSGPYVALNSYTPTTATYGTSVGLGVEIENIGNASSTSTTGTLTTEDGYASISDGSESFGTMAAGAVINRSGAFGLQLASNVPDQHVVSLDLDLAGSGDTWEALMNLTVNAPAMALPTPTVNDGDNGRMDPNESLTLRIPVTNNGHAASPAGSVTLTAPSSYISIGTSTVALPAIAAGATSYANFQVTIGAAPVGTPVSFYASVDAGAYDVSKSWTYSIGLIVEDWESAGFTAFDWALSGDANWFLTSTDVYEGGYCAQSGDIDDYGSSLLSLTADIAADGELSFMYKVSSESNYDKLRFSIDGVEQDAWSGEVAWTEASYEVESGSHTFTWSYTKDVNQFGGSDCAWVDYILFPAMGEPAAPVMTVNPTSLAITIPSNTTDTATINVSNSGNADLDWSSTVVIDNPVRGENEHIKLAKGEERVHSSRATGTDDFFGYTWMDSNEPGGPTYDWIEISGTGEELTVSDDTNVTGIDLGFTFSFYGNDYTTINVCTNGFASFTSTVTAYTNGDIYSTEEPNNLLAVLWDDMDPSSGGSIHVKRDAGRFIAEWDNVPHWDTDELFKYEIILYENGQILYQYHTVGLDNSCTIGIENADGTDGAEVINNTAGYIAGGMAIRFSTEEPTPPWMTLAPTSGTVGIGSSQNLTVSFDTTDMETGVYYGTVYIQSNDPNNLQQEVPVTLTVGPNYLDAPVIQIVENGTGLRLEWDAVENATSYQIWRAVNNGYAGYSLLGTTTETLYAIPDALADEHYFYKVVAIN